MVAWGKALVLFRRMVDHCFRESAHRIMEEVRVKNSGAGIIYPGKNPEDDSGFRFNFRLVWYTPLIYNEETDRTRRDFGTKGVSPFWFRRQEDRGHSPCTPTTPHPITINTIPGYREYWDIHTTRTTEWTRKWSRMPEGSGH